MTAPPGRVTVLHLLRSLSTGGGIQTYLANLVSALEGTRVDCRAASVFPGAAPPAFAATEHRAPPDDAAQSRLAWQFGRWLRPALDDVDVVHVHGLFTWQFLIGASMAAAQGVPVIASPHGCLEPWFLSRRSTAHRLYIATAARVLMRRAFTNLVTAPSEALAVRSVEPRARVDVVHPGLAIGDAPLATLEDAADGALRVLFLSRLEPKKGLPVLLKAVRHILDTGRRVHLDVVGFDGPEDFMQSVDAEARALALGRHVTFHGPLSEPAKREVVRRAHVFALPSYTENFGFVVAEAMAAGLPVVTTREVALHEAVERCGAGRMVRPDDVAGLAAALEVYRDLALRRSEGARGHRGALQQFSLQAMGRELERIYLAAALTRRG